jgi:plastocyanin
MRPGVRRWLLMVAVAGMLLAILPAVGSSTETSPTVKAEDTGLYTHAWAPNQVAVGTGGAITVSNATGTPHGVHWVGGPVTPVCGSGVPVGTTAAASSPTWTGTCTFAQAGTYTFYCTVHGPEMTETVTVSTPGAPTSTTGEAKPVGETEATLHGAVNPQGKATKYHFNYGTTASYGKETAEESAEEGSLEKAVSTVAGLLTPGTTYHYQLVAKNAAGTTPGADRPFTTSGPPSLHTSAASAIGETSATLNGTVTPNGLATTFFFEWGLNSEYGHSTAELPAGADNTVHAEAATLPGLTASTTYHFRLVAKNAAGTVPGTDQAFTTKSPPEPEPEQTPTTPIVTPPPATGTQTPPPPPVIKPIVPLPPAPRIAQAPSLFSAQHGTTVKGSIYVLAGGTGSHVEVDVFAKGASLAKAKGTPVLVGRFVRGPLSPGRLVFTVKLNAKARGALKRHHSLVLSVRITVTPTGGRAASVVTRSVVLR